MNVITLTRKVELVAVAVASTAAGSGLGGVHVSLAGLPLDRAGMWADLVAGAIFVVHQLHHRWTVPHI
jgi:hypothetical protein